MLPLSILLKLISLDFIIRLLKFEDSLPLEAEYKLFLAIIERPTKYIIFVL